MPSRLALYLRRAAPLLAAVGLAPTIGCGGSDTTATTPPASASAGATPAARAPKPKADWYAQHHGLARIPCGDDCSYARHLHSEVSLHLGPNGRAEAIDHGERLEEANTVIGDNARLTRWKRRWEGSWTEGQGKLAVSLQAASTACERITRDGHIDKPCQEQNLELVCERAKVLVSKPKKLTVPGWVCIPRRRVRNRELTPLPWVFGEDQWLLALERGDNPRRARARRRYAIGDVSSMPGRPR